MRLTVDDPIDKPADAFYKFVIEGDGLMPHPERFIARNTHYDPDWNGAEHGWGLLPLKNSPQKASAALPAD